MFGCTARINTDGTVCRLPHTVLKRKKKGVEREGGEGGVSKKTPSFLCTATHANKPLL